MVVFCRARWIDGSMGGWIDGLGDGWVEGIDGLGPNSGYGVFF